MASHGSNWSNLASTLRNLSQLLPGQSDPTGEADLYYRRACLAAAEERYDVALVFCTKAVEVSPRHLAITAYRKVIALAGYDGGDPHCVAAREALDLLVQKA
jgi:hypothetical protein